MSGDKSENTIGPDHLNDYWIVKIDNTGNIEWENTIGGTKDDALYAIQQTPDGGYIVGGGLTQTNRQTNLNTGLRDRLLGN